MFTRRWLCGTAVLLALVLVAAPRAGAEPVAWDYTGQVVTTGPNFTGLPGAGPPDPHLLYGQIQFPGGPVTYPSDQVQFADVTGSGSSTVTGFQMRASTDFTGGNVFSANVHTFNFGFTVLDAASGASGTLTFHGNVSGSVSPPNPAWGVPGEINLQVGFTGATTQSLVLGDHRYTVDVSPLTFQSFLDSSKVGQLPVVTPYQSASVSVQVADVPEPATLTLAVTGLAALGLNAWRRRRRGALAPPAVDRAGPAC